MKVTVPYTANYEIRLNTNLVILNRSLIFISSDLIELTDALTVESKSY